MRLITGPLSMFGRKVEIALYEKALDFELEIVPFSLQSFYNPVHSDVERVNPKRQVPILQHGDLEIFDSTLIFEYLEEAFPQNPLWPTTPQKRAEARLTELLADEVFFPNVQMLMPHKQRDFDSQIRAQAPSAIQSNYSNWNEKLSRSDMYFHDAFGFADIAVFTAQFFATLLGHGPSNDFPALQDWTRRVMERRSIRRVVAEMTSYTSENG